MLKRLYVNNYRCFINFEINFDQLTLLMGPNGGCKSTLFDLLFEIRQLIAENAKVNDIFPQADLTEWVKKPSNPLNSTFGGRVACLRMA